MINIEAVSRSSWVLGKTFFLKHSAVLPIPLSFVQCYSTSMDLMSGEICKGICKIRFEFDSRSSAQELQELQWRRSLIYIPFSFICWKHYISVEIHSSSSFLLKISKLTTTILNPSIQIHCQMKIMIVYSISQQKKSSLVLSASHWNHLLVIRIPFRRASEITGARKHSSGNFNPKMNFHPPRPLSARKEK